MSTLTRLHELHRQCKEGGGDHGQGASRPAGGAHADDGAPITLTVLATALAVGGDQVVSRGALGRR